MWNYTRNFCVCFCYFMMMSLRISVYGLKASFRYRKLQGSFEGGYQRMIECKIYKYTLWLFNLAMENGPFIDGLPNLKMVIFHGYVTNNQRVYIYTNYIWLWVRIHLRDHSLKSYQASITVLNDLTKGRRILVVTKFHTLKRPIIAINGMKQLLHLRKSINYFT